ncbi:MAG: zinc ABC transporter substrate-binding protein [Clostridia bacterium]|nr:zinc ABC transporter substrate-binding protein [Clostridia bacterium]
MRILLCILLTFAMMLSGCSRQADTDSDMLSVVCTSFPSYDFAKNIAGEKAEVKLLVPVGTDTQSYDPTPTDMIAIDNADLFVAGGGESDEWARELLATLDNGPDTTLYMTELVPTISIEDDGHGHHIDEHIWTSPVNAVEISRAIADTLSAANVENAEYYAANFENYAEKISVLDGLFRDAVSSGVRNTVVFGDRFPFLYLAEEYGLDYAAAFSGCSELTEPAAKTVSELIEKVRSENIPVVFYVEFSNGKICDAICAETGAKSMLMHSVHNLTKSEFESGADYISIMTENAKALKEALG